MEKRKWTLVNAENVVPYVCGPDYSSKMLTGDEMAGQQVININEGTLQPHMRTGGDAHEKTEIYYMVDVGDPSYVVLDGEFVKVKNGDIIIIPGGVFHYIDNLDCDKPFKLFTLWPEQEQNGVFFVRQKAWGTSVKNVDDNYTEKRLGFKK